MRLAAILPGTGLGWLCVRRSAAREACRTDWAETSGKTGSRRPCGTENNTPAWVNEMTAETSRHCN